MKFMLTCTVATLAIVANVSLAQTTGSPKDPPQNHPNDRKKSAWDNLPARPQHDKETIGGASAPLGPKPLVAPIARAAPPVPAPGAQVAGGQLGKAAAPSISKSEPLSPSGKQSEGQTEDDLYIGARKQVRPASGSAIAPTPRPAPSGQQLLALPTTSAPQTQSQQPPVPASQLKIKASKAPAQADSMSGGNSVANTNGSGVTSGGASTVK